MKLEEERRLFIASGLIYDRLIPSPVMNQIKKNEDITMESQSSSSSACVNDSAMSEGITVITVSDKNGFRRDLLLYHLY